MINTRQEPVLHESSRGSMNSVTPDLPLGASLFGRGSALQAHEDLIFRCHSHKSVFSEACIIAANEFSA